MRDLRFEVAEIYGSCKLEIHDFVKGLKKLGRINTV